MKRRQWGPEVSGVYYALKEDLPANKENSIIVLLLMVGSQAVAVWAVTSQPGHGPWLTPGGLGNRGKAEGQERTLELRKYSFNRDCSLAESVWCACGPVAHFMTARHLGLRVWMSIVCLPHACHRHSVAISCLQGKGQSKVNERKWVYNWSAQSGHAFPAPAVKLACPKGHFSHDNHAGVKDCVHRGYGEWLPKENFCSQIEGTWLIV